MTRRTTYVAASLAVTAAVSFAAMALPLTAQAGSFPGRNGKIVYVRDLGTSESVSVIGRDGSGRRNFVPADANTEFPDASADGKMIVFDRSVPSNSYDIFRMTSDGKRPRNLTKNPANDWGASISPDGAWVAFASNRGGDFDIWIMTIDGKKVHRLLDTPQNETEPQWSPNGKRILYLTEGVGVSTISSVTPKGAGYLSLTTGEYDYGPVWSPNGKKIAFFRNDPVGDIWIMNADGSNQQNITDDGTNQGYVAWSPDGNWLAYEESNDIWAMRTDGSNRANVTDSPEIDIMPSWLPIPSR